MLIGVRFDALDVAALGTFWADATRGRTGGVRLAFDPTDRPKAAKNRVHLDLAAGPDRDAELERLLALGATRIDIGQGDVPWTVLADPEGNEFCLLAADVAPTLGGGALLQICLDTAAADLERQTAFWRATSGWNEVVRFAGGVALHPTGSAWPRLIMGPPVAPPSRRDRVRLEVLATDHASGEYLDPAGNTYVVARPRVTRSGDGAFRTA